MPKVTKENDDIGSSIATAIWYLIVIAGIALSFLLNGCIEQDNKQESLQSEGTNSGQQQEQATPTSQSNRVIPVVVTKVEGKTVKRTVKGIGNLRASKSVEIQAEIAGIIDTLEFEEATRVNKGDLLISIDDENLQRRLDANLAALEGAKALLTQTKRDFERFKELYEEQVVSEQEYDDALTAYENAQSEVRELEAQVALVREEIDDTKIYAPFDGLIARNEIDPGDYVREGEFLTTIHQISPMEVSFRLPEQYASDIEPGQKITVHVQAFPEREFQGNVDYIEPAVRSDLQDLEIRGVLDNPDRLLKPGMFAEVEVLLELEENQAVIPEVALLQSLQGHYVFVIEEETAQRRDVELGTRRPGEVEIKSGVKIGERIVTRGQINLDDGTKVKVVPDEKFQQEQGGSS